MKRLLLSVITILTLVSAYADNETPTSKGFTWGAEIGSGIDMGGDNMSTLNLGALIGYRGPWLEFAGIGLGIDIMMSNSCRAYPIYAMVRSSFSRTPRLLFAEMRCGVAVNQDTDLNDRGNLFLQPGVGIHLATGRDFSSYITLSYTYNDMKFYGDKKDTLLHGLNMATLSLGVTF